MTKLALFPLLLAMAVSGCIGPYLPDIGLYEEVPPDFEVQYSWGACHMDWGWNDLNINRSGEANLVVTDGMFGESYQFELTEEELLEIYGKVRGNFFFSLNERYSSPYVTDGSCSGLRVKADGREHKVSVANKWVWRFDSIANKITDIVDSKITDWREVDQEEICSEAELECRPGDIYRNVSCEIWERICRDDMIHYNVIRNEIILSRSESGYSYRDVIFNESDEIPIGIKMVNKLDNDLEYRIAAISVYDHQKIDHSITSRIPDYFDVSKVNFCDVDFPASAKIVRGNSLDITNITIVCEDISCTIGKRDCCEFIIVADIYVTAFGSEKKIPGHDYYVPAFFVAPGD